MRRAAWLPLAFALGLFFFQTYKFCRGSQYFIDDPFISMRFAGNLVEHGELSFNPGERVEGYSNFLDVVLHALTFKLRGGVPGSEEGLDEAVVMVFAATLLELLVLGLMARRSGTQAAAWSYALVLTACSWPVAFWACAGLETPLEGLVYVAILLATTRLAEGARRGPLVALGALLVALTLLRFEAVIVALAVAAAIALHLDRAGRRRAAIALVAPVTALSAAYHLWRLWYFGQLMPNTYLAKATGGSTLARLVAGASYCGGWIGLLGGGITLAVLALAAARARGSRLDLARMASAPVLLVAATIVAVKLLLVTWGGGDWMPGWRMLVPVTPIAIFLAMRALLEFAGAGSLRTDGLPALLLGVALVISGRPAGALSLIPDRAPDTAGHIKKLPGAYLRVGLLIERAFHGSPEEIALGEAGLVPFEAFHVRFLDLFGLVDEDMARQPGGMHERVHVAHLLSRAPAAVLFADLHLPPPYGKYQYAAELLPSAEFHRAYRLVDLGAGLTRRGWALYLRRDVDPAAHGLSWAASDPRFVSSPMSGKTSNQSR